mmetsp:Transcript_28341/g.49877  ORF Transcript_28341/g.49877 Transcript_28341/m.49877 type:complete len:290 (+) Transcript_28341:1627-2496(+)
MLSQVSNDDASPPRELASASRAASSFSSSASLRAEFITLSVVRALVQEADSTSVSSADFATRSSRSACVFIKLSALLPSSSALFGDRPIDGERESSGETSKEVSSFRRTETEAERGEGEGEGAGEGDGETPSLGLSWVLVLLERFLLAGALSLAREERWVARLRRRGERSSDDLPPPFLACFDFLSFFPLDFSLFLSSVTRSLSPGLRRTMRMLVARLFLRTHWSISTRLACSSTSGICWKKFLVSRSHTSVTWASSFEKQKRTCSCQVFVVLSISASERVDLDSMSVL